MAGSIRARGGTKEMTINAVITRADGTVEDLGTISYFHKNPLRRLAFRVRQFFTRISPF